MSCFDFKSHYESLELAQTEAEIERLRRQFDDYWNLLAPEALPQAREEFSSYLKEFNQEQMIRIDYLSKLLAAEVA